LKRNNHFEIINMKNLAILMFVVILAACNPEKPNQKSSPVLKTDLSKEVLKDKIKGGWAGQVIGCTFGGPTEFRYKGSMINDYQPIPWEENSCLWYYENAPGLYDDIYMDLTFVDVFEKEGLDAPAKSHARAFANAEYQLWHANQAARYNILNGIMPPESGHWLYNPHSEDIDFQIEADFAGLMSPGMVNTMAFVSDNIEQVVVEALKAIPEKSNFHQCMADVIDWHHKYPGDWKRTWFEVEKKWSADIGCPDGVFMDFNIDAKINAAYILIGLLYGEGDYSRTLEISTRCGQDSDCNPASAGGILGTMLGYSNIPEFWKKPLYKVEDMDFRYTTLSLNDVYETGTKHALNVLRKNGAKEEGENIEIPFEDIDPVRLEVGFEGHYPIERIRTQLRLEKSKPEINLEFSGIGFALQGWARSSIGDAEIEVEMSIDGGEPEEFIMPTARLTRKHDLAWKYQLNEGDHVINIRLANPQQGLYIDAGDLLVYGSGRIENTWKSH